VLFGGGPEVCLLELGQEKDVTMKRRFIGSVMKVRHKQSSRGRVKEGGKRLSRGYLFLDTECFTCAPNQKG